MTASDPVWTNRRAALAVSVLARDVAPTPAERRELLDMLGLLTDDVQPCTQHRYPHPGIRADLTDDEARVAGTMPVAINGDLNENQPSAKRMARIFEGPPLNGALCPPGLRAVIQGAE